MLPQLPLSISVPYGVGNINAVAMGSLENSLFFGQNQIWDTSVTWISNSMQQSWQAEMMVNVQKEKKMNLHNILVWQE